MKPINIKGLTFLISQKKSTPGNQASKSGYTELHHRTMGDGRCKVVQSLNLTGPLDSGQCPCEMRCIAVFWTDAASFRQQFLVEKG